MRLTAALMLLSFSGVRAEWIKPKTRQAMAELLVESKRSGRPILIANALH